MENINIEIFNEAVLRREATWWQMELPFQERYFWGCKNRNAWIP